MPELPEVETTRRGITPHITGQHLVKLIIRQPQLRWLITENLGQHIIGARLEVIDRRAKYLLFKFSSGYVLIHLGMSGSLRILDNTATAGKHDHVDFIFSNNRLLRFTDPRRFGAILWLGENPWQHKLLKNLGPEPLSEHFTGFDLYQRAKGRKLAVKQFIMDQHNVTGVGNIYANEALFLSGIRPGTQTGRISIKRYERLVEQIKRVLTQAIAQGGTTLRDFVGGDGKPGYFKQQLFVYGRGGQACKRCHKTLKEIRHSGRSTVYCLNCQK